MHIDSFDKVSDAYLTFLWDTIWDLPTQHNVDGFDTITDLFNALSGV